MDFDATLAEIERMPIDDRIRLVHAIWDGIAEEPGAFEFSDAQKRELERRIADADANPDDVLTWEEVKASFEEQEQASPGLPGTQKRELDRRIAASDANPDDLISWDELRSRLRQRRS